MSNRNRLEDIGRICEKLNQLCEHDLFNWMEHHRPKDAEEWFFALSRERQEDIIHTLAYNIQYLDHELHEIYSIARWGDEEDG